MNKFFQNTPALLGAVYLAICMLAAVLGYIIAPDKTRHANFQVLEMAKMPPGSRVRVLMLPSQNQTQGSAWTNFWMGKQQEVLPIPLSQDTPIQISGSYLRFTRLNGLEDSLSLNAFPQGADFSYIVRHHIQTLHYRLGTDNYGRDLLSRILLGTRVSLSVGLMSVLISLGVGILLGAVAGYFGGGIDRALLWFISVVWSLPTLLLALALSFVLGKGLVQVFVAIGLSTWVEVARLVRGQILSVKEQTYVEAARVLGLGHTRTLIRHILPNILAPILVIAVANFASAVLIESGLSFLGIGVEAPIPSWGRMIYEGYTYIVFENGRWLAFYPGLALILLIISINLIGIGLRDALDIKA